MATNNAIDNKAYVFNSDTTITAGTGITATTGNIAASAGAVSASTTVTAGTNLVSTAGNLLLPMTSSSTVGNITMNYKSYIHSYASETNFFSGTEAGNYTSGQVYCTGVGYKALSLLSGTAASGQNTVIGANCFVNLSTGSYNSGFGAAIGIGLSSGSYNIMIGGKLGGSDYTGKNCGAASSSNIYIENIGANESNKLRIGSSGSGDAQINDAWIGGIYTPTTAIGGTAKVMLVDSADHIGGLANTTGALLHVAAAGTAPIWSTGPTVTDLTLTGTLVLPSTEITADTYNLAINKTYVVNNANMSVCQLPATAPVGSWIEVIGKSANMWKIESTAAKNMSEGATTTSGAGGKVEATQQYTSIMIKCITADAAWVIVSRTGTVTIA